MTALTEAAQQGHVEFVKLLLQYEGTYDVFIHRVGLFQEHWKDHAVLNSFLKFSLASYSNIASKLIEDELSKPNNINFLKMRGKMIIFY